MLAQKIVVLDLNFVVLNEFPSSQRFFIFENNESRQ